MTEHKGLHEPEPIEQVWDGPHPAQDSPTMSDSGENANVKGLGGAPAGLLALIDEEWAARFWAIKDLAERARALTVHMPLTCEDAEWVALIRSVNDPTAGDVGAHLQDRIGSERAWEEERQHWKRKMKEIRKSLAQTRKDFESFENLYHRLYKEGHLLLTKQEYHEKAIEDWLWDLDHLSGLTPTVEEFARSNNDARKSGEKWLAEIKAREHEFHLIEIDFRLNGEHLSSYRNTNLALADRGDSKITRAEFWKNWGRSFDPTRLSLNRALLGDLAPPAGSLG